MREDNKVDFDLSTLSLEELIKVYESVERSFDCKRGYFQVL